jgi:hypothetical protein
MELKCFFEMALSFKTQSSNDHNFAHTIQNQARLSQKDAQSQQLFSNV